MVKQKKLKIGIIGLSPGNGHPFSWAAIFNGYNKEHIDQCDFPVIIEYLNKQNYPQSFLGHLGNVTHIYTQSYGLSSAVSRFSNIKYVSNSLEEMVSKVDAVLLARDDAENHIEYSLPFLKAGLPIFIDKPFALSVDDAKYMLENQSYEDQIFTCSSLRYANELRLTDYDKKQLGEIRMIEGIVPKKWETYSIHILEPSIIQATNRGKLLTVERHFQFGITVVVVTWENLLGVFKVMGSVPSPIELKFYGERDSVVKRFHDSYSCFKASLASFTKLVMGQGQNISRNETLELVEIIEKGI